ncbi:MAG: hypothetical protein ACI9XO_000899 [Paraglaciecola sp.]|jgi:hypothetical protein
MESDKDTEFMLKIIYIRYSLISAIVLVFNWNLIGQCNASFSANVLGETVTLLHEDDGNYTRVWSVDGVIIPPTSEQVTWTLNDFGFHTICLTVSEYPDCESTYCNEEIFYGDASTICDYTDCVYPGDADGNGVANVYDLLNISLGYGTSGPARNDSGFDWDAAYSPNWNEQTINGIDYKHLDCNGDGYINELDLEGIEINYTPADNIISVTEAGAPEIWLEFTQDTIYLDEDSPSFFTIEAKLMVANPINPIDNLKGFSLVMNYPEDLVQEGSPEFDYHDNSFFGNTNEIIWMPYDRPAEGKFDVGFAKKWGSASGAGEIGTLQIIIVSDIIGGRTETYTPIKISLEGITAIGENGAIKALEIPVVAEMTVVNTFNTTATNEQFISDKVSIYPNPATDALTIDLGDLTGERVEVYNTVGQRLMLQEIQGQKVTLAIQDLEKGVHLVKVWTDRGVAVKKVLID